MKGEFTKAAYIWQRPKKPSVFITSPPAQNLTSRQVPPIFLIRCFFLSPLLLPGNMQESHCFLLGALAKPQHKQRAAISGPSCQHVCSAAYLFKPAAGPGGPARALPGASLACLRIHSHLRIKLLTLMLLVMLGPAPTFGPINLQELGNIGHVWNCHIFLTQTRRRVCFVRWAPVRPSCVVIF